MKSLAEQNFYEVLELAPAASPDEVEKAYNKAKEAYAPGSLATYALAEPGEAAAVLKRVEEAYAVLSNPDRRSRYDKKHGWSASSPAPSPEASPEASKEPEPSAKTEAPLTTPSDEVKPSERTQPPEQKAEPVVTTQEKLEEKAAPPESTPEVTERKPVHAAPPPLESSPTDPSGLGPEVPPSESASIGVPPAPASMVALSSPLPSPTSPSPVPPAPSPSNDKPVRKTEAELPPDGPVTGEALKRVREARGLTLKDLANKTKIGHWHLDAIEREKYADFPAQVYLRGFLMSLARELKLDPVRVSKSYLEQMKSRQAEKVEKP